MIHEIQANYVFQDDVSLEGIEDYIRGIRDNVKLSMALIATALGRIKRDGLYYSVSPSFRAYIEQERNGIQYREALRLAKIGENYWKFQPLIRKNNIKVSENMTKLLLLDIEVIERDPVFWENFKSLSTRQLTEYVKRKRGEICAYPIKEINSNVSVKGTSLFFGDEKVLGININEIREQIAQGRRAVVLYVDNDTQARKVKKTFKREKEYSF